MSHRSTLEPVVLPGEIARAAAIVVGRPLAVLTLALLVSAAATPAHAAANCTAKQGQLLIDEGRYQQAIKEFTCVIEAAPTEVEGYRGRIEAQLLLGQYSNSVRDYARVTAVVTPVHPDAQATILAKYASRLETAPNDIRALTGASFAHWWYFDYLGAIGLLDRLLDLEPGNPYGNLFRGSSRLLKNHAVADGVADLDYAIALVMTTGANLGRVHAIAMTMMRGRSGAAPATTGKDQTRRDETAITIPAGPIGTATRANAIPRSGTRSCATFTCHEDASASWFTIEIASTRCVAPSRER